MGNSSYCVHTDRWSGGHESAGLGNGRLFFHAIFFGDVRAIGSFEKKNRKLFEIENNEKEEKTSNKEILKKILEW